MSGVTSRKAGADAEELAARFLVREGFEVLARNYTVRGAEVDIIAREGDFVVFVEVKCRKGMRFGSAREGVSLAKQRRISLGALYWLQENGLPDANVRFDIVEVTPLGVALLRGAFEYIG